MTVRWLPLLLCAGCTEYDFHNDKAPEPPGDDGLPVISVAPGAVDLGIVQADETGEEVVTIANIGTGDLVISALTLASGASWSRMATVDVKTLRRDGKRATRGGWPSRIGRRSEARGAFA